LFAWGPYLFVCVVLAAQFIAILLLNDGRFVYTLDDPYIHLALSESLAQFHYGIHPSEFSAPSSSILWPFLLAPAASLSVHEYLPLGINVIAALFCVRLLWMVLELARLTAVANGAFAAGLICILISCLNITGLVFTGMEHSLQVMLALAVVVGMIEIVERDRVVPTWWFMAAVVLGPQIRYENAGLSLAAVLVMAIRGQRRLALLLGLGWVLIMGAFSLMLLSCDLPSLASSVLTKSHLFDEGSLFSTMVGVIKHVRPTESSLPLWLMGTLFVAAVLYDRGRRDLPLLLFGAFFIACHLVAGRYGRFARYEIYVLVSAVAVMLYSFRAQLKTLTERSHPVLGLLLLGLFIAQFSFHRIRVTVLTPLAANNIYQQQYQMHRFVTEFYKKPVVANDIGWVSYRNESYVLDLYGLASEQMRVARLKAGEDKNAARAALVGASGIELVMTYFPPNGELSQDWIPLAYLDLSRKLISAARARVVFYATSAAATDEIRGQLEVFGKTLPPNVRLETVGMMGGPEP
jgi:hypothetical protein